MSFILDALKKSETERQRKSTPGVADIPDARTPSRTPRWLWAVAGLLAVNLGVLVVILLRPGAEAGTASVSRPLELPDNRPAPFSELVAEAKENRRQLEAAAAEEPEPSRAPEPAPPARSSGPRAGAAAEVTAPPPRALDIGALSTYDELRARGVLALPDLHVDLHVYADRPADRFIIVNMQRYGEGAALAEGPRVQQILPNGAVLEHQGTEFFLPRL